MAGQQLCQGYHSGGYRFDTDTALWVCATCGMPTIGYLQTVLEFSSDEEHATIMAASKTEGHFINALQQFLHDYCLENGIPPFEPSGNGTAKAAKAQAAKAAKLGAKEEANPLVAELSKLTIPALRKRVIAAGYEKDEVNEASKEDLIATLVAEAEEAGTEEDTEPETDEEESEDEGEEYTREDFEGMGLRELQRIAKEEYEYKPADYKGKDKDTLISFLLGEDEDAEDEEEAEEEPDEDEEEEGYTEEDLNEMSPADLRAVGKELGLTFKVGTKKSAMVEQILEAQE